jgi:hypothetical protein
VSDLPNVDLDLLDLPDLAQLEPAHLSTHPPRILLLYGSLRQRSYSRLLVLEAERLLRRFGTETRVFDPHGLPLPDSVAPDHPKVQELREGRTTKAAITSRYPASIASGCRRAGTPRSAVSRLPFASCWTESPRNRLPAASMSW